MYGERIKQLRNAHNFTQEDLSIQLEVSRPTVNRYERETRDISTNILIQLSQIFNVSTDYILGITDKK